MSIQPLPLKQYKIITNLYKYVKIKLRENHIFQWDRYYPNRFIILQDLWRGHFFGMKEGKKLLGVVVLNSRQSKKYQEIQWDDMSGNPLCIHRLAVHPNDQGKGIGKKLLQFAEEYAKKNGFSSIRLDVYTENPGAVSLYERAGYTGKGQIRFPFRKIPYQCFEKVLT